ncbi:hypothetical protein BJ944DRAFT_273954, partial [Cunninghamella echinulata]
MMKWNIVMMIATLIALAQAAPIPGSDQTTDATTKEAQQIAEQFFGPGEFPDAVFQQASPSGGKNQGAKPINPAGEAVSSTVKKACHLKDGTPVPLDGIAETGTVINIVCENFG